MGEATPGTSLHIRLPRQPATFGFHQRHYARGHLAKYILNTWAGILFAPLFQPR